MIIGSWLSHWLFGCLSDTAAHAPREAVTNLGIQVIASQGLWAHATAGSGVSFTAGSEDNGKHTNANSSNVKLFKPSSVDRPSSSIAFTDVSQGSSAVAGMGEPVNRCSACAVVKQAATITDAIKLCPALQLAALPSGVTGSTI